MLRLVSVFPLLDVTWFDFLAILNKHLVTEYTTGCARLSIVGLVLLTCWWHWKTRVRGSRVRLSSLASSIYILYAMQHDFPATSLILFSNTAFRVSSKASENCRGFLFSSLCLHTAVVHPPRVLKSATSAFLLLRSSKATSSLSKDTMIFQTRDEESKESPRYIASRGSLSCFSNLLCISIAMSVHKVLHTGKDARVGSLVPELQDGLSDNTCIGNGNFMSTIQNPYLHFVSKHFLCILTHFVCINHCIFFA
jgi:hypothetical protein